MKKIGLLIIGIMTAFCFSANAQYYLSLGPVVGFGHSWTTGLNGDARFKPSPDLGIGLVYSRNSHWGLGGSLIVSHEGYSRQFSMYGNTYDATVNPVYLRMPLYVSYFFGDYGNRVRPKVYLGPSIAVKIDERSDVDGIAMPDGNSLKRMTPGFRTFDAGVHGGVGANIRLMRNTWLNLDAGYYQGLVDVLDDADGKYNMNGNLRLNAGLMFGL
jgi:hypothetical protein